MKFNHRFILTEACNAMCPHCFNAGIRETDKQMDSDKLIRYIEKHQIPLRDASFKFMGGEPLMHPDIVNICKNTLKYHDVYALFTNGIKLTEFLNSDPKLVSAATKNRMVITINSFTYNPKWFHEIEDLVNGVSIHFVITYKNPEKAYQRFIKATEELKGKNIIYIISNDTTIDYFDMDVRLEYKKIYKEYFIKIMQRLHSYKLNFNFDHQFPRCFLNAEDLIDYNLNDMSQYFEGKTQCYGWNGSCVGLIKTNFDFYHCNQTNIKLGTLLTPEGNIKEWGQIKDMILKAPIIKRDSIKKKYEECQDCPALDTCLQGCYYKIKDDICYKTQGDKIKQNNSYPTNNKDRVALIKLQKINEQRELEKTKKKKKKTTTKKSKSKKGENK